MSCWGTSWGSTCWVAGSWGISQARVIYVYWDNADANVAALWDNADANIGVGWSF